MRLAGLSGLVPWCRLIRPGDWCVLAAAALALALLAPRVWQGGLAERAIIRQDGAIIAEVDLQRPQRLEVSGPLGITVIEIEPGQARVAIDPGPRQYCVHQGWLRRPGELALCAPNRVSLQIAGRTRAYDTLSY